MQPPELEVKEIVLRDLQSLLRRDYNKNIIVDSFTTKNLLPPGENYGSTILSVHAIVRKNDRAPKEDLHLIAKMLPPTEYQRQIFDSPYTFRKESFMYEGILPGYNQLEREVGLKDDEVFNVLPKFYGTRYSLDPNVDIDDDAVILMENLKEQGYYTGKRNRGYDLEHSKMAIRAMARFHGLGMALKYKKPELFEVFKNRARCLKFKEEGMDNINMVLLKRIKEDPQINKYYERIIGLFERDNLFEAWTATPEEPWSTIIHSDFWVNNILFHRGEDGKVDDVKFVDFQNYLFLDPIRELIFFLYTSTDTNVQEHHIDKLMDLYNESLIEVLTRMGCDTVPFSKEKFHACIPTAAKWEFAHIAFMLKVLTLDANETKLDCSKIETIIADYEGNDLFAARLRLFVSSFGKRKWI